MDIFLIEQELKNSLKSKRFEHTMNVARTASKLAIKYGCDEKKAYLAGLLHDCAKKYDTQFLMGNSGMLFDVEPDEFEVSCPEVFHATVGAEIARKNFGIDDEEILNAIRYHTVANENMTTLDKILYIADLIEPSRDFQGIAKLRALSEKGIDICMLGALRVSIEFILKKDRPIHIATIAARNKLLKSRM